MNLDFNKESLFEHFRISSNCSRVELNRQFQIKPELRKELPHYIQILNNEKKLFAEELFNTYIDGHFFTIEDYLSNEIEFDVFKKKLASFINAIRRFDEVISTIKISGKTFDTLLSEVCNFDNFEEFKHSDIDNAKEIYKAMIDACLKEIQTKIKSIINTLNSKGVNSLYRVLSAISNDEVKNMFLDTFYDNLGTTLETLTLRKEDKKLFDDSVNFLVGLTDKIFKDEKIYQSYKFCCNKLFAENVKSDKMIKLIGRFDPKDLKPVIEKYINTSLMTYILFENIHKYDFEDIQEQAELAQAYVDIAKENGLKIENIDILKILIEFNKKGEKWYEKYKNSVSAIVDQSSLSSAIYNVCVWVYHNSVLSKNKILFTNLILRSSDFERRIDSLFGYINRVEEAIERKYGNGDNEYLKIIAMRQAIIEKQDEMLDLIIDFYAITIISPDLVKTFDQIYLLMIENASIALERMEKCDDARGVYLEHKNVLDNAGSKSNSYSRSTVSSDCYIASCVYGSYNCPQVWTLRRYRDNYLGKSWGGKLFIKFYYAISPTLVKLFGNTKWFKSWWKKYLDKKIEKLKEVGYESTPYNDKKWK